MAELSVSQLIKIIIGVLVIAAVVTGMYLAFKNDVFAFFDRLPGTNTTNFLLGLFR